MRERTEHAAGSYPNLGVHICATFKQQLCHVHARGQVQWLISTLRVQFGFGRSHVRALAAHLSAARATYIVLRMHICTALEQHAHALQVAFFDAQVQRHLNTCFKEFVLELELAVRVGAIINSHTSRCCVATRNGCEKLQVQRSPFQRRHTAGVYAAVQPKLDGRSAYSLLRSVARARLLGRSQRTTRARQRAQRGKKRALAHTRAARAPRAATVCCAEHAAPITLDRAARARRAQRRAAPAAEHHRAACRARARAAPHAQRAAPGTQASRYFGNAPESESHRPHGAQPVQPARRVTLAPRAASAGTGHAAGFACRSAGQRADKAPNQHTRRGRALPAVPHSSLRRRSPLLSVLTGAFQTLYCVGAVVEL